MRTLYLWEWLDLTFDAQYYPCIVSEDANMYHDDHDMEWSSPSTPVECVLLHIYFAHELLELFFYYLLGVMTLSIIHYFLLFFCVVLLSRPRKAFSRSKHENEIKMSTISHDDYNFFYYYLLFYVLYPVLCQELDMGYAYPENTCVVYEFHWLHLTSFFVCLLTWWVVLFSNRTLLSCLLASSQP